MHALCSLNETTVRRQTTYEDLRMIKSVVRPQDFMLILDVESVYFHVPIHPQHRKFFSSHLAFLLFVNNKFIELQTGGYFVCTRPDLTHSVPSVSNPDAPVSPLLSSGRVLPCGLAARVDEIAQNLDKRHVDRSSSAPPPRHTHTALCRRFADRLQFLRRSNKGSTNHRGHAPRRGHRPCGSQDCFDTPTQTLPDHLGFIISSIGKGVLRVLERRCFALRCQARALLFEAVKNRRLVDSELLCCFTGATISCLPDVPSPHFHLREIFNVQEQYKPKSFLSQEPVDILLFWRNFSIKSPENLQELCPDPTSTAFYTDNRTPRAGARCCSRPTRPPDRVKVGGLHKKSWR